MQVIHSLTEWKALRPTLTGTLGLIPTMGALHDGHLSLIRRARAENGIAVLWIFVNPKQFGEEGDFAGYPRVMDEDLRLAGECGVDYVLAPGVDDSAGDRKIGGEVEVVGILGLHLPHATAIGGWQFLPARTEAFGSGNQRCLALRVRKPGTHDPTQYLLRHHEAVGAIDVARS